MKTPSVLIVGAGPVGLTSALILANAGIHVRILERSPTLPRDMRASTFHPPTLDLLAKLGLTQDLIAAGLIARNMQQWSREEGLIADFDLQLLAGETEHPFRLQCEQWKLTDLLAAKLTAIPHVQLDLGVEATAITQHDDSVSVMGSANGVSVKYNADYLIGADGAWSTVRRLANIEFEGFTYPERFLFVSTDFEYADRFPGISYVNYFSDPQEWCVLLRVPQRWRVLFPIPTDCPDEVALGDPYVHETLQRLAPSAQPYQISHRTIYKVHQRVARNFRLGRILLAGDAAHINNPLGGMGMNGGVQDAFNLSGKLIEILLHGASSDRLDTYERQRRTIAIEYINANTARNKRHIEETDPARRQANIRELRRIASDPRTAKAYLREAAMLDAVARANAID